MGSFKFFSRLSRCLGCIFGSQIKCLLIQQKNTLFKLYDCLLLSFLVGSLYSDKIHCCCNCDCAAWSWYISLDIDRVYTTSHEKDARLRGNMSNI